MVTWNFGDSNARNVPSSAMSRWKWSSSSNTSTCTRAPAWMSNASANGSIVSVHGLSRSSRINLALFISSLYCNQTNDSNALDVGIVLALEFFAEHIWIDFTIAHVKRGKRIEQHILQFIATIDDGAAGVEQERAAALQAFGRCARPGEGDFAAMHAPAVAIGAVGGVGDVGRVGDDAIDGRPAG